MPWSFFFLILETFTKKYTPSFKYFESQPFLWVCSMIPEFALCGQWLLKAAVFHIVVFNIYILRGEYKFRQR